MSVVLLGLLDILAAVNLFALAHFSVAQQTGILFAFYLAIKSLLFFRSWSSYVDFACAIIFVIAIFGTVNIVTYIAILWLVQKGILSLI